VPVAVALTAAAAFGVGYEIADGGIAATLFLTLAGVALVGATASSALLVATVPPLVAAPCAYAGGSLRERRSET
jgi:hypothetical protein